jgi:hypothetical protein
LNFPPSVPEANIWQEHFFQLRRPSSNLPVLESSGTLGFACFGMAAVELQPRDYPSLEGRRKYSAIARF